MRQVSVVGVGQLPVCKTTDFSLQALGAKAARLALNDAGSIKPQALFAANMLADELQSQKSLAAMIADELGLVGIEAIQARAASASGAAALRMAYLAVASSEVDVAVAVGAEKMSQGRPTPALAKALDRDTEQEKGATMISLNAQLMRLYFERHAVPEDGLANFSVNAHHNAMSNPLALFNERSVDKHQVMHSRVIEPPLRLFDSSPLCDGSAAVVLVPRGSAREFNDCPVHILASAVATDRFRWADRQDPLQLKAAHISARRAYDRSSLTAKDIDLFEVHDAFTIMACLQLEAAGFAEPGEGWRLAEEGMIGLNGTIPICTFGGLKARGHPIGATGLYQACEIFLQLSGRAGVNQVAGARIALTQSVGGLASSVFTHIFATD